jgi:mitogen-activated protein kinase 1/3
MFLEDLHLKTIIYEVLKGVKYMHEARVVHRDIKPANILINQDCSIKICDFGLSRSIFGISGSKKIIESEYQH